MDEILQEALNDAMQAQVISPIWDITSYLQAADLSAIGKENGAQSALTRVLDLIIAWEDLWKIIGINISTMQLSFNIV